MYINIDTDSNLSIEARLLSSLKHAILSRDIKPGEKLTSSRELSSNLNISRNVVINCYEQLIAEGYAYSKNGSGTYVCDDINAFNTYSMPKASSQYDSVNIESTQPNYRYSYRTGIPDLSLIPIQKWSSLYYHTAVDIDCSYLDYRCSLGEYSLRLEIATYLNSVRGTIAKPENIIITNGAAQSFSLLAHLVEKKEYVLVEDPSSYGMTHTFTHNKVQLLTISQDDSGMITDMLPKNPPKLILTTPSHQFPTGVVLPIQRRLALINYVNRTNSYIVEDDYDSEYRFVGHPLQSLQGLAPGHVIYVGTFSKTLMPSLRIGYMILPDSLIDIISKEKYICDIHTSVLDQLTLAEFIRSGSFAQHIRKMRKIYAHKRKYLVQALTNEFGSRITISGADAGLHLVVTFIDICFTKKLLHSISNAGIEVSALSHHCLSETSSIKYHNSLVLGYGNTPACDIRSGVHLLKTVIDNCS